MEFIQVDTDSQLSQDIPYSPVTKIAGLMDCSSYDLAKVPKRINSPIQIKDGRHHFQSVTADPQLITDEVLGIQSGHLPSSSQQNTTRYKPDPSFKASPKPIPTRSTRLTLNRGEIRVDPSKPQPTAHIVYASIVPRCISKLADQQNSFSLQSKPKRCMLLSPHLKSPYSIKPNLNLPQRLADPTNRTKSRLACTSSQRRPVKLSNSISLLRAPGDITEPETMESEVCIKKAPRISFHQVQTNRSQLDSSRSSFSVPFLRRSSIRRVSDRASILNYDAGEICHPMSAIREDNDNPLPEHIDSNIDAEALLKSVQDLVRFVQQREQTLTMSRFDTIKSICGNQQAPWQAKLSLYEGCTNTFSTSTKSIKRTTTTA